MIEEKERQLEDAIEWCKTSGKKGYAAIKTGLFPLIKDCGTIDRRLNGNVINSRKEYLQYVYWLMMKKKVCWST